MEHKTITLDLDEFATAASVKAQIEATEGIPVDEQWFLDFNVEDKDYLEVKTAIHITVHTIGGKVIPLSVFAMYDNIMDLKYKILDGEGIPFKEQRLIFNNKEVFGACGNPLSYFNIVEGSELYLIRSLEGLATHSQSWQASEYLAGLSGLAGTDHHPVLATF